MKLNAVILSLMLLAGGCATREPERTDVGSNKAYEIDQLFVDRNGYTVYRFWDHGAFHYYVVGPRGDAQMVPTTRLSDSGGVQAGAGIRFH